MKVSKNKCIFHLSKKSMQSTRTRNGIAIIAIALTTLLFTALFTIMMSITLGFEQANFRRIGTCAHGEFKRLTEEQYLLLKEDNAIAEYGLRRIVGISTDPLLAKQYAEISYMDENTAKWSFITPTTGNLPLEGTAEAAADTRLLELLEVPLVIGSEFSITMEVDGTETTESFVLCGWWEYDGASPACNILIPHSRVEQTFEELNTAFHDESIGRYMLTIMLKDARNIEAEMDAILSRYGYSPENGADNAIDIGVNWGYMSESFMEDLDFGTIASIALLLLLIIFTGYLIIYNVFRISVSNEIRHYGMLKTIGTTGAQLRRLILFQAITLSLIGIPLGLVAGWGTGALLAPIVIQELNVAQDAGVSTTPSIFVFSAIFALITVLISCFKPGKIAAAVSPIEALRYTENAVNNNFRKGKKGVSLLGMAAANLAGSKSKTTLTIVSLSLSVVLFTLTLTFTNSFSIEKYLADVTADFQVSTTNYFNSNTDWQPQNAISPDVISILSSLDGITDGGSTYGFAMVDLPQGLFDAETVRTRLIRFGYDEAFIDDFLNSNQTKSGKVTDVIQVHGLDEYCLDKLTVKEGDLSRLTTEENYAAVTTDSALSVDDTITVRYVDSNQTYHYEDYRIAAKVEFPNNLSYRYYVGERLLLPTKELLENTSNTAPLYYAFDATDDAIPAIEAFLAEYTDNRPLAYESRATIGAEFESFKQMFLILGSALSFIVALVGMLNFINTVLTGILSRKKELATLQAIGMTGRQLRTMLIYEGLFYTAGSAAAAIVLNLLTIPMASVLEKLFWFCEYRFTMLPMVITVPIYALMGILIPTITYAIFTQKSVVERLRETE